AGGRARWIDSDEIAFDLVSAVFGYENTREIVEHQTAYRRITRADIQSPEVILQITLELDKQHGIVAIGERVRTGAGLGITIDRHRIADRRQVPLKEDRLDAVSGNIEKNRVVSRMVVGGKNRFTQRGVVGVGRAIVVIVRLIDDEDASKRIADFDPF